MEGSRRSHRIDLLSLPKNKGDVLFAGERLNGTFLDDLDDFWFAVGVNLLIGDGFDELAVVLEDVVHLVF